MKISTCALLVFDAPGDATAQVVAALTSEPCIRVDPCGGEAGKECRCVVVIIGAPGFERAFAFVDRFRQEAPRIALFVAGIGLDAAQLTAVLSLGVHDFVSLPCTPHELLARVRRALGLVPHHVSPRTSLIDARLRHLIGSDPRFVAQVAKLPVLAGCDAGVLMLGETGTGKEICAQAVHYLSARARGPWVAVNCGAMPTELVENELFGHVKGAYTTAHAQRSGLVREAEGGTLFLDDIDCLPLPAQVKLLRFVQEREYRAVGSNQLQRADVRIIAASNDRLPHMVVRGEFRQDLYFRLNVLTLELPPLRERVSDVPELARHFVSKFAERHQREVRGLSPAALDKLLAHDWPGNIRELQHALERAVLLSSGSTLDADDIEIAGQPPHGDTLRTLRAAKDRVVRQFERAYIERMLASCGGNITRAAQQAGKNRRAFFELMRKHEISAFRFKADV
jgi:two-component system response regulator GlrR